MFGVCLIKKLSSCRYPNYTLFVSVQNVETKGYPQDLKRRIREKMIPVEEN